MTIPSHTANPTLKRPSPDSETQVAPLKKQKSLYHHHLERPLDLQIPGITIGDEESAHQLLDSSIRLALREAGFELAEYVALDAARAKTEERESYPIRHVLLPAGDMLRILSYIRQSMYVCRRTQPIPQDFEHAFRQESITFDSLRPHMKPPPPTREPPPLLPTPPPEEPPPHSNFPFLGADLSGTIHQNNFTHIPEHFPKFPSRHTYQETEVFTKREVNPRKVREQATEEGRLGEEALRKLTRAAKNDHMSSRQRMKKKLWGRSYESMETMFDKTLKAMLRKSTPAEQDNNTDTAAELPFDLGLQAPSTMTSQKPPLENNEKSAPEFEMGPIVNCDKENWRSKAPPGARRSERPATQSGGTG